MDINNESISSIQLHLKRLYKVLVEYRFLIDSYIIEFFVEDHWKKIPSSWRDSLHWMQPPDVCKEVFHEPSACQRYTKVLPLSLLAFKAVCFQCSLPRSHDSSQDEEEFDKASPCQSKFLNHIFRKHVNPKKQHEIRKLSEVILEAAAKSDVKNIVDVGSGQGYLSRLLSIGHNLNVTAIEAKKKNVEKAQTYDTECMEMAERETPAKKKQVPSYVVQHIERYIPSEKFMAALSGSEMNKKNLLLTGLHACGDLSATMIDTFVKCEAVRLLVSVSCCYMKMTKSNPEDSTSQADDASRPGFPMSKFVASISNHQLSYKSREISCHANEKYRESLKENGNNLKMHCYRAVLEHVIRKHHPEMARCRVQTIKKVYLKPFHEYAKLAFEKLSLPPYELDQNDAEAEEMLSQWHNVVTYYVLSVMLAPLIETVILLDRAVYLYENGITSTIRSIFNPQLSPRCFALVAGKTG